MTTIEAVGLVAGLITLFETGYLVGSHRRRKQIAAAQDEYVAKRLRQVLGAVHIRKLECSSYSVAPGRTFSIALKTASEAACALEVWIGASLVHHTGREHYDASQDKPVMLEPGSNTYHRALTVPLEVPSGDYALVVAVWLGKPGNPDHSVRLDRSQSPHLVKVREE